MNAGNGSILGDIAVSALSSTTISSKTISSLEHIDKNIVDVEKDIFELQDVALQMSEETMNVVQDLSSLQNSLVELQYVQSLPWFCKSNFTYEEVGADRWNVASVSDSHNPLFIRVVELEDTYTGMILCLPRSLRAGETRSVSVWPKSNEACVYINTNPNEAVRLTSMDLEWVPGREADVFVGHKALLSKPAKMNNFLFGSVFSSSSSEAGCVVFPDSGPFYLQTAYLDNNSGSSKIVFIFQKYQASLNQTLPGFSFYGVH